MPCAAEPEPARAHARDSTKGRAMRQALALLLVLAALVTSTAADGLIFKAGEGNVTCFRIPLLIK